MLISLYSLLLTVSLTLTIPWWLYRMATSGRYRAGILERLGRVPPSLRAAAHGRQVIWLHAVSVGELLAAQRLIAELQTALPDHLIAISTTTATAQQLARERLPAERIFFYPLDFRIAVRPWLRALRPRLVILMESELWPRLLHECAAARIPVAVANARVSDRSFRRTYPFRSLWLRMARHVTLFLAQSHETAARLEALGIPPTRIQAPGNLKYDLTLPKEGEVVARLKALFAGRKIVVAGSTLDGEEAATFKAWGQVLEVEPEAALILAPRHAQRFREVEKLHWDTTFQFRFMAASSGEFYQDSPVEGGCIVLLDTLGDLAGVYALASVAFIGGSLVPRGGHNPLEAARFGVPILMGPSYENFREIVAGMIAADAIRITSSETIAHDLTDLLENGQPIGQRAQAFFHSQAGATARTIAALLPLLHQEQHQ